MIFIRQRTETYSMTHLEVTHLQPSKMRILEAVIFVNLLYQLIGGYLIKVSKSSTKLIIKVTSVSNRLILLRSHPLHLYQKNIKTMKQQADPFEKTQN